MTTTVLRHRCDLCGETYLLERQADWCERMCAEEDLAQAIEARRAETPESGSVEDESAVAAPCARKGSA